MKHTDKPNHKYPLIPSIPSRPPHHPSSVIMVITKLHPRPHPRSHLHFQHYHDLHRHRPLRICTYMLANFTSSVFLIQEFPRFCVAEIRMHMPWGGVGHFPPPSTKGGRIFKFAFGLGAEHPHQFFSFHFAERDGIYGSNGWMRVWGCEVRIPWVFCICKSRGFSAHRILYWCRF